MTKATTTKSVTVTNRLPLGTSSNRLIWTLTDKNGERTISYEAIEDDDWRNCTRTVSSSLSKDDVCSLTEFLIRSEFMTIEEMKRLLELMTVEKLAEKR